MNPALHGCFTKVRRSVVIAVLLLAAMAGVVLVIVKLLHPFRPPHTATPRLSFTLVVSADTAGWIMPCGCTANQSGGLLRRATYLDRLRHSGEVLYADAGGAAAGTSEYQKVKFEAVLAGELAMKLSAHNIGRSEALLGPEYLRGASSRLGVSLISANARDASGKLITDAARIVSMAGRRIALVGVLSPSFATGRVSVTPPREAILSALAPMTGRYDSLVVLAYLPEPELRQLATDLPEADAVIGGPTNQAFAPRSVGPTLVAASTNKGKFLVRIDVPPENNKWTGDVVEMGPDIPDEPLQQENLRRYLAQLGKLDLTASQTGLVEPISADAPAGYRISGSAACAKCHQAEYNAWSASGHGQAWEKLTARGFEVDPSCQQCHTTGYGLPDGFESAQKSPQRVEVGCEDCHGPSLAHTLEPGVRTPFAATAGNQCVRCHDHENSPNFDFAVYWPKIAHGWKGRP